MSKRQRMMPCLKSKDDNHLIRKRQENDSWLPCNFELSGSLDLGAVALFSHSVCWISAECDSESVHIAFIPVSTLLMFSTGQSVFQNKSNSWSSWPQDKVTAKNFFKVFRGKTLKNKKTHEYLRNRKNIMFGQESPLFANLHKCEKYIR